MIKHIPFNILFGKHVIFNIILNRPNHINMIIFKNRDYLSQNIYKIVVKKKSLLYLMSIYLTSSKILSIITFYFQ